MRIFAFYLLLGAVDFIGTYGAPTKNLHKLGNITDTSAIHPRTGNEERTLLFEEKPYSIDEAMKSEEPTDFVRNFIDALTTENPNDTEEPNTDEPEVVTKVYICGVSDGDHNHGNDATKHLDRRGVLVVPFKDDIVDEEFWRIQQLKFPFTRREHVDADDWHRFTTKSHAHSGDDEPDYLADDDESSGEYGKYAEFVDPETWQRFELYVEANAKKHKGTEERDNEEDPREFSPDFYKRINKEKFYNKAGYEIIPPCYILNETENYDRNPRFVGRLLTPPTFTPSHSEVRLSYSILYGLIKDAANSHFRAQASDLICLMTHEFRKSVSDWVDLRVKNILEGYETKEEDDRKKQIKADKIPEVISDTEKVESSEDYPTDENESISGSGNTPEYEIVYPEYINPEAWRRFRLEYGAGANKEEEPLEYDEPTEQPHVYEELPVVSDDEVEEGASAESSSLFLEENKSKAFFNSAGYEIVPPCFIYNKSENYDRNPRFVGRLIEPPTFPSTIREWSPSYFNDARSVYIATIKDYTNEYFRKKSLSPLCIMTEEFRKSVEKFINTTIDELFPEDQDYATEETDVDDKQPEPLKPEEEFVLPFEPSPPDEYKPDYYNSEDDIYHTGNNDSELFGNPENAKESAIVEDAIESAIVEDAIESAIVEDAIESAIVEDAIESVVVEDAIFYRADDVTTEEPFFICGVQPVRTESVEPMEVEPIEVEPIEVELSTFGYPPLDEADVDDNEIEDDAIVKDKKSETKLENGEALPNIPCDENDVKEVPIVWIFFGMLIALIVVMFVTLIVGIQARKLYKYPNTNNPDLYLDWLPYLGVFAFLLVVLLGGILFVLNSKETKKMFDSQLHGYLHPEN